MKQVSSIDSMYIDRADAIALVQALKDEGFNVEYKDCHEYAMNVINTIAGGDGSKQRLVRSIIADILDVEEVEK